MSAQMQRKSHAECMKSYRIRCGEVLKAKERIRAKKFREAVKNTSYEDVMREKTRDRVRRYRQRKAKVATEAQVQHMP
jgi:hypothetical protein